MKFIKDPTTDILFSPILPKDYSWLYESRYSFFYTFEVTRQDGGYTIVHNHKGPDNLVNQKNYNVNEKPIKRDWIKINGIWGGDLYYGIKKGFKWHAYLCHVDLNSLTQSKKLNTNQKSRIKDSLNVFYLKPKYNLDRETEKVWGEIIKEL